VLATFGLILFFNGAVHLIWGPEGNPIALPEYLNGRFILPAGIEIPTFRVAIIATGLAVAAGLIWLVTMTRMGMLIRAGASNRRMAGALGVDIKKLFTLVFALGAAMAGLAGMMITPITEANIGMGDDILIVGMIDVMERSYLDGFMKLFLDNQSAETASPALSAMVIYILMVGILYFRPRGLFPPRHR